MIAHDLDEIQHLERAGELESNQLCAVCRHDLLRGAAIRVAVQAASKYHLPDGVKADGGKRWQVA
jgi:hypothetical protein